MAGANVNGKDEDGGTPLFYAAAHRRASITKLLLDHGANLGVIDIRGGTALCYALGTSQPNTNVIAILLERGALNVQPISRDALFCVESQVSAAAHIELLLKYGVNVNSRSVDGYTALMKFAYDGNSPAVALLIRHGAMVNVIASDGGTALSEAVLQGNEDVVKLLIAAGADKHVNYHGCSLVDIAEHQRKFYLDINSTMVDTYSRIISLVQN
jgi:ankyrin repeat protein